MADPARKLATYVDVLAAPPNMTAQVIGGDLHLQPRPSKPHTIATSALGEELGPPFKRGRGGPGGWMILDAPELHLGDDIVVPDLAGWRRERMQTVVDDLPYFTLAPDWVAEVLSPSTTRLDRTKKPRLYAQAGVSGLWFIDPVAKTLEVFERGDQGQWVLRDAFSEDAKVKARPFDAITLDLSVLWAGT